MAKLLIELVDSDGPVQFTVNGGSVSLEFVGAKTVVHLEDPEGPSSTAPLGIEAESEADTSS